MKLMMSEQGLMQSFHVFDTIHCGPVSPHLIAYVGPQSQHDGYLELGLCSQIMISTWSGTSASQNRPREILHPVSRRGCGYKSEEESHPKTH